jgi:hypothetical protein
MAWYIDGYALYKEIERIYNEHYSESSYQFIHDFFRAILRRIRREPIVDAVPVVHGRWKYYHKENIAVCTNCSFERDLGANFGKAISCPNCGAKMDLEVE